MIAHYNEKFDWVEPIANHCHGYHKGNDLQPPPMGLHACDKLPNVRWESHPYLHHIITEAIMKSWLILLFSFRVKI